MPTPAGQHPRQWRPEPRAMLSARAESGRVAYELTQRGKLRNHLTNITSPGKGVPMQRPLVPRIVAASVCLVVGAPTVAQPAGSPSGNSGPALVTPSDLAPRRIEIGTDPALLPPPPPAPRQLARPDDDVKLKVVRYELPPSAPAALVAALPGLTARFTGESRSFGDLTNAAREVTRFLQSELGYYLGLAYIPEQDAQDGVIRIALLEGRLDRIELLWPKGLAVEQAVVEQYLSQIKPGDVLMSRDVERMVFLLNDLRGISAEFEVVPGAQPGTARFIVRPKAVPRLGWSVDLDNGNSEDLGEIKASGTVSYASPFGRGDNASATLVASQGLAFGLASYTLPLNRSGLRVGVTASALQYKVVKGTFAGQGIRGTATTASVFGMYPWLRSRDANLFVSASIDGKSYSDDAAVVTTDKKVQSVSLGLTGDLRDNLLGGGLSSLDVQLLSGRIRFGVTPPTDAPTPNFTKLGVRAVRLQSTPSDLLQVYAALRAQMAFDNLDSTEQFRVGGPDGVRAFSAGQGGGDSGVLATLELRLLVPEPWLAGRLNGRASVAVFVDAARVQLRHDPAARVAGNSNYENFETLAGAGVALQWDGPDGWSVRASAAGQLEAPRDRNGAYRFDRSPRFFAQIRKQF